MKRQAAQPRRVPRDRRDDRYDAGHPTPYKHASAGWVLSVQDDTVTVRVSGEELTGVIPLGDVPPVGAIVEVEARGDLLCIPTWFEGPVPSTTATVRLRPTGTIASRQGATTGPVVFTPSNDSVIWRDGSDATWARMHAQSSTQWSSTNVHFDALDDGITVAEVIEVRYAIRYLFNRISGSTTTRNFATFLYANDADFAAGDDAMSFDVGAMSGSPPLGPDNATIYDYLAPIVPQPWMTPPDVEYDMGLVVPALHDNPLMDLGPWVIPSNSRQLTIYDFCIEVDYNT